MNDLIVLEHYPQVPGEDPSLPGTVFNIPYRIMVKVPEPLYQIFYDWAQTVKDAKDRIFKELVSWAQEHYPGYGILTFEDYSRTEAIEATKKLKQSGIQYTLSWGMYVVLQYDTQANILSQNQIEYSDDKKKKQLSGEQTKHTKPE